MNYLASRARSLPQLTFLLTVQTFPLGCTPSVRGTWASLACAGNPSGKISRVGWAPSRPGNLTTNCGAVPALRLGSRAMQVGSWPTQQRNKRRGQRKKARRRGRIISACAHEAMTPLSPNFSSTTELQPSAAPNPILRPDRHRLKPSDGGSSFPLTASQPWAVPIPSPAPHCTTDSPCRTAAIYRRRLTAAIGRRHPCHMCLRHQSLGICSFCRRCSPEQVSLFLFILSL